jgi:FtsP/CotA-like multicopper oxidase with cupredoxin domain
MTLNRRNFIRSSSVVAAGAGLVSQTEIAKGGPQDPYEPADKGRLAKLFNKGEQHVLPAWAFQRPVGSPLRIVPHTIRPVVQETWEKLSGGASHQPKVAPYASLGDNIPLGKAMHGIAVEWNGNLIGGNLKYDTQSKGWGPAASAWEAMRERVRPETKDEYGVNDLGNWGKFGAGPTGAEPADAKDCLVRCYKIDMFEALLKVAPAFPPTMFYTYQGTVPGPMFRFRHGMPAVVRFQNKLQTEVSIHHHGGHNPTHADGFPSFYVLQGEARDYMYPNILPLRINKEGLSELDFGEGQSTTWYHDHGLDATAFNVMRGLSGFALWFDEVELSLIRKGVLPGLGEISALDPDIERERVLLNNAWRAFKAKNPSGYLAKRHELAMVARKIELENVGKPPEQMAKVPVDPEEKPGIDFTRFYRELETPYFNPYDLPLVLQDRVIDPQTGQILYDSDGHNGYIGNTQLINGVPWPVIEVKRRKYRLRLLDGSNARIYRLRFLDSDTLGLHPTGRPDGSIEPNRIPEQRLEGDSMEFYRIGKDSWLWPTPQKRKSLLLNMANRADLVVDFKAWYEIAKRAGRLTAEGNAEFYMVNTMPQFDGRGPKGKLAEDAGDPNVFPLPFELDPQNPVVQQMAANGVIPPAFFGDGPVARLRELDQPIALVKFVITPDVGEGPDATIDEKTILRPRHAIEDQDVMAVREFVFERGKGAWMINSRFYDPTISNGSAIIGIKGQNFQVPSGQPSDQPQIKPSLSYAEEWIFTNGGGGWWHPIHVHLEGHQLVGYEKDFEADGLVGADGILGAQAQAQMAGLPSWNQLVGTYGFDRWIVASPNANPTLIDLRDTLQGIRNLSELIAKQDAFKVWMESSAIAMTPDQKAFLDTKWSVQRHPEVLRWFDSFSEESQARMGRWSLEQFYVDELTKEPKFRILLDRPGSGAALFDIITAKFANRTIGLPAAAKAVLDGLGKLKLQWAGDIVGNHDTQALGPNTVARIRMRFRTWSGPLVFHCHNVEHEDMRMMLNFEPTMSGRVDELNQHDPNVDPAPRTHGQDVTDLLTNPSAIGEMPWEAIDGFPSYRWEEKSVPGTDVNKARDPLIPARRPSKTDKP